MDEEIERLAIERITPLKPVATAIDSDELGGTETGDQHPVAMPRAERNRKAAQRFGVRYHLCRGRIDDRHRAVPCISDPKQGIGLDNPFTPAGEIDDSRFAQIDIDERNRTRIGIRGSQRS